MINSMNNRGRQPRQPLFSEVFDVFELYEPLDEEVVDLYVEPLVYTGVYVVGLRSGFGL